MSGNVQMEDSQIHFSVDYWEWMISEAPIPLTFQNEIITYLLCTICASELDSMSSYRGGHRTVLSLNRV